MSAKWVREAKRKSASQVDEEPQRMEARLVRPLGQGEALAQRVRMARRGQLPHGVVVEGPRGSGKTTVLQWLAAALLCPSELDVDEPCAVCNVCTRIANELHPDVHVVRRPRDESEFVTKQTSWYRVTVHQVRALQERIARHAVEGGARVATFVEADRIEEDGQNMLLKTLEEPGDATFLLLESSMPERLLPTVRSRLQRLRVLPLGDDEVRRQLEKQISFDPARSDVAVALARGSLGMALELMTERAVQLHDLVRAWLGDTQRLRPYVTARSALDGAPERRLEVDQARAFLWVLRAELMRQRDALAGADDGSYPAASLEPWTTWLERTLHAERDLELMIPPEQVLTACLAQLV